ncbi:MBL fold metallo-hydrolase [Paenibacillus sp. YPG26]|uniref:MBL fold metallo-hydrolase n=1 Tax=Paenibacillus sp. YPG26 TaxID=2878915 RepID=UPI00203A5493|nr:MBL fold metallo-hydrolase [Paenibacillus sp. YPG26]USB33067.1 MBL fold metallo-hydrolase [Paenibacillus sp. YPG26]
MPAWIYVVSGLLILTMMVYLYILLHPVFGGRPSQSSREHIHRSKNRAAGRFVNQLETSVSSSLSANLSILYDMIAGGPGRRPRHPLNVVSYSPAAQPASEPRVTWFGHSALLLELDGKRIFLDPMLGRSPSPTSIAGGKRYSNKLPCEAEDFPELDAVILSHDHYDHLDYATILKLRNKVRRFFVPLGVSAHLERWGISPERIEELDWWEETDFEGIRLACTPARHFSGRSLTRNTTLWCSWVLHGQQARIFYSGDSGYGPHFAEIGTEYGPFDLTLMECGQYDQRWASIHMMPEETVQAHLDVRGAVMMPIHWAAFTLALHPWTEPVERARSEAARREVKIITPRIGETVRVGGQQEHIGTAWWREAE